MWSELLSWHRLALSFVGRPILIDTHVLSMPHRLLHSKRTSSNGMRKEMFPITWPCRANPSTGLTNLRLRHPRPTTGAIYRII